MKLLGFILSMCLIINVACDDPLEVIPENSVTFENFFKTDKDMEAFLNSLRTELRGMTGSMQTPAIVGAKYDTCTSYYQSMFNWEPSQFTPNHVDMSWSSHYALVTLANILLEQVDGSEISEERKTYYKGQAHFYRALMYFWMAQKWGECPLQTSSRDITAKPKESKEKVLQFALDEVNLAISMLPRNKDAVDASGNSMATKKYNACKEVAQTLKLEICLWKAAICNQPELLDDAIKAANYVIDSCDFQLAADPETVCEEVMAGGSTEGIFEVKFDIAESMSWNNWHMMYDAACFPVKPEDERGSINDVYLWIKQSTIDEMYPGTFDGPIKDGRYTGDKRRLAYVYEMDTTARNDEWRKLANGMAYPYKFRKVQLGTSSWNLGQFERFANDWIIWRLADVILLRAEAYARKGEVDLAAADINRIRERAYGDRSHDYTSAEGDIRYAVFKERERELLWEGKRWWDIVRNNYWKTELWEFHRTELTQADVDRGALYMPIMHASEGESTLITQNEYWQSRY